MKRKLFLLLCALLTSVGMWAQKDVTSLYITNATLSNGTTGWTVSNFNTPVNGYNRASGKNSNATEGYATEAYAGYDNLEKTSYSLTQNITLPAGNYTLVNYSFFRQGDADDKDHNTKSLAKLKAGSNEVTIKTLRSISAASYADSQWEGADCFDSKMYRNTLDFTIDADNTTIEIGVVGTFDEKRSWCILGMFELIDNDTPATMDAPFDVTGYITNPGFEYRNMNGWTLDGESVIGVQNNDQGFKSGWYYAEKWQKSGALPGGSMSQTLTSLPAGLYRLTANLGGNGTYIDLNGKTGNWTEDKDYTVGYVLSENEDLTITAGKTDEGTANWIHFDNFRLFYCGDVQAALNTLLGQLSGYEGTIPSAAYSALQTAVAVYDKEYSDVDELLAAIAAVQDLYAAADLLVSPYATFNAMKAEAQTLQSVANDNATANSTLSTAISDQTTNVEAATTASAIETATSTLKTAMQTYVYAANPVGDGAQFDCTFMLVDNDLTGYPSATKLDSWYTDQEFATQNSQTMTNNSSVANTSDPTKYAMYEYWSDASEATEGFTVYQKLTLPVGTYRMDALCMTGWGYHASNPDGTRNITFSVNDVDGTKITTATLEPATLDFVQKVEGEIKIGLKAHIGNTTNWMGIGYVELYKVPAKEYELDENTAWESVNAAGDVKLTRTFKEGVNTVVFPFSMTQVDVESYFGAGSVVYQLSSYEEETETIHFTTKSGISANEPCLVDAKSTTHSGVEYTLVDRTIVAGTPSVVGTGVVMTGTYAASTTVAQGNYIVSGSNIYYVNSDNVKMKNTRAYITLGTPNPGARELILDLDGEATSISAIEAAEAETSGLKDGKYLIEGKIVLVKNGVKYDANGKKLN